MVYFKILCAVSLIFILNSFSFGYELHHTRQQPLQQQQQLPPKQQQVQRNKRQIHFPMSREVDNGLE